MTDRTPEGTRDDLILVVRRDGSHFAIGETDDAARRAVIDEERALGSSIWTGADARLLSDAVIRINEGVYAPSLGGRWRGHVEAIHSTIRSLGRTRDPSRRRAFQASAAFEAATLLAEWDIKCCIKDGRRLRRSTGLVRGESPLRNYELAMVTEFCRLRKIAYSGSGCSVISRIKPLLLPGLNQVDSRQARFEEAFRAYRAARGYGAGIKRRAAYDRMLHVVLPTLGTSTADQWLSSNLPRAKHADSSSGLFRRLIKEAFGISVSVGREHVY